MSALKLGRAVLLLGGAVAGPADAKAGRIARTVEIITMTAAPRPPNPVSMAGEEIAGGGGAGLEPSVTSDFRAHDLSRRWVEFDMGNSFASASPEIAATRAGDADPFARVGVAQLAPSSSASLLQPPPAIAVPAWMRGGLAFSAAASRFVPGCAAGDYRPSGILKPDAEGRRYGYYAMMSSIACEYGIPVGLFDAMIIRESRYRPDIFSPKNAFGLTQLMPDTAAGLGVDRFDIEQNLRGGARYLRQQLDRYGQVHLALAAYNAGPGRVRNGMLPRIAETQAYVDNVLLNWRRLAGFTRTVSVQSGGGAVARPTLPGRAATISSF